MDAQSPQDILDYWKEWRSSKTGLVQLCQHKNWREHLKIVPSEDVFAEWLRTRGWKPTISDKGHIAKQMLKHLGGKFGVNLLAKEGVVELMGIGSQVIPTTRSLS